MKTPIFFFIILILLPAHLLDSAVASEKPEIFAQLGHSGVQSIVFSSDGKYVLSGGDKTVKLWDVGMGREIRTFSGHEAFVSAAVFSRDERYILSSGMDKKIILWDKSTGKEVKTFTGHAGGVFAIVFSPDGKYAASGSMDKTIKIWDISSGREVRTFSGHTDTVRSVVFSPDGRYILSGSWDKTIKLWDVSTGREIRTFAGHTASVSSVAFSPDGKYAISAGGKDKTIKIWNVDSGKERSTLHGHVGEVFSVAFSPDGRFALSGSFDRKVKLWDISTGREINTFICEVSVFSVAFSPDGKYILAGSRNISLWDIASWNEVKKLEGKVNWVRSVAFSYDGKYALSGNVNGVVNLWEAATGRQIRAFNEIKGIVSSLAFSPDDKLILDCRYDGPVKLWDAETGREVYQLGGQGAATFSHDGRLILSGGTGNSLKLWNAETGRELKTFIGHTDKILSVAFSSDGKYALSGSRDKTLRLWDISSGQEIRVFRGHKYHVNSVAFSPDSRYVLSGSGDNTIKLWDAEAGNEIRTWQDISVSSVAFSPDGRSVLSGGFDNTPKLWEIATGKRVAIFQGHRLSVYSVIFSSDGKRAITGSGDGTTRIWDLNAGREIAQFIGFTDGEWIIITPEGYYNSSLKGHEYLNIRVDNKVYSIDQFYDVFYRPDIVTAKLKGEDMSSLITLTIDKAIKDPPPLVEFTYLPKDTIQPKVKVCYQVKSTGGGIGEVRLFHNGKLVHSDGFYKDIANTGSPKQLAALSGKAIYEDMRSVKIKEKAEISQTITKSKGGEYNDCREIDAISGENEVSIVAFNSQNTVQSYMKTSDFNSSIKGEDPKLYIFSIGIDKYKDNGINLKYAVKDAMDMKEKVLKQSATLYKPGNIYFEMLTDKDAVKGNIISRINEISARIKPSDSFILFVAGHGVLLQNQYYMLTHDYDGQVNEGSMISSNEIVEMSKKISSLSQLFIFDTCHAGGVDYIVSGLYDARMSVLAKKMGLHIYASANSKEAAMDGYQGNGLFTYTLLDGLNNKKEADKNRDNKISLMELGEYSKITTENISKKIGHQQTPLIINFGKDNILYNLR